MLPRPFTSRRLLLYALLVGVCLIVYRYALTSWFRTDDFAWLSLGPMTRESGWLDALFSPRAQGTVRVLSERLFFIGLRGLFGPSALAFHIWIFLTQFANLYLVNQLTERWTGSAAAGVIAACAWAMHPALAVPLSWASAYNQILCGFFLLTATFCLVRWIDTGDRRFAAGMWTAYLLGFGALELTVVFPALALAYSLSRERGHWRKTLPLWIPAIAFAAVHLFLIPKPKTPVYEMYFDGSLVTNLGQYALWAVGPSRLGELGFDDLNLWGFVAAGVLGAALVAFLTWKLIRRDGLALFLPAWLVLLIAPVLPLKNHVSDYYVALPAIAAAMAIGWAAADLWPRGTALRAAVVVLGGVYAAGMITEAISISRWQHDTAAALKRVVLAASAAHEAHPERTILLNGIDTELFNSGFADRPFAAFNMSQVFLAPGSEGSILPHDPAALAAYRIAPEKALDALEGGKATLLQVSPERIQDETQRYVAVARSLVLEQNHGVVKVGQAVFASRLGDGWFPPENGFRWMGKSAVLHLGGPKTASEHLIVDGYAPKAVLAAGPLTMTLWAAGEKLGDAQIASADQPFTISVPVAAKTIGVYDMEVRLEVNRVFRVPGDQRELGIIVGSVAVR